MNQADTENMRTMRQLRDRDPVENAALAMGALAFADQQAAVAAFNAIWCAPGRPNGIRLSIEKVTQ
jgi:hypothetical protein